jgi:triacylglycerol lipase
MRKLLLVVVVALGVVFLGSVRAPTLQADAATRDPILFVHGYLSDGGIWDTMIARFKSDGWRSDRLYAISYDYSQSNVLTAYEVRDKVDQIRAETGASKVDIISHSMGGLSTRYYLKYLGGTAYVDEWVSLAGPNHGTLISILCAGLTPDSCLEMLPGSSLINALNSGDETPGSVRYGTWWSPCDEIIIPSYSTILSGARNTMSFCVFHIQETLSYSVYRGVRDFVR